MARTSNVVTLVALLILKISTMAKHNLFLGQARGKVGSVVFSRLNGVQITRAYNPSPKNPKSWPQATQRAAFASISQYYKVFRYLIEQGQQGVKVGQPSIQDWQRRTLKQLTGVIGSTPMVLNAKGVQYPQLLPISLTNGSLPSLSYDIQGVMNSAGDTHYGLCLTFNDRYTTTEALAAMTLGDVYAMTPGLQKGFQLTFALLGWSVDLDKFDYYNKAFAAMWAQYVIAEDADETLPFFVDVKGDANHVQINPAILTSSWGERFTPRWSLRVINNKAVAYLDAPEYVTDGSGGIIAGCCITSYYNGSAWARSTSPMAIASDFARIDQNENIETYQRASKSTSSDLYLNQAKTSSDVAILGESTTYVVADGVRFSKKSNMISASQTFEVKDSSKLTEIAVVVPVSGATPTVGNIDVSAEYEGTTYNVSSSQTGSGVSINITDIAFAQVKTDETFSISFTVNGIRLSREVMVTQ